MLTWANQITIVRILLIIPFVICMLKVNEAEHGVLMRYVALCIFLFMCISDFLDGYMARVKHQVTKIGSFLDPMADKLLIMCACVLLASRKAGIEGFILPQAVVVMIIGKDVLVSLGFITIYFVTSHVHIFPVFIGKLATVLQLSMVAAVLLAPELTQITDFWIYFVKVLWWSAAATAVLATLVYIRNGLRYIEQLENITNNKKKQE